MINVVWIAVGGGLGALARFALSNLLWTHQPLPYNIFLINISGSFLIAVVMTLSLEYGWLSERGRLFLAVGVLGGYTTFSTFMLGVEEIIARQAVVSAYTYTMGTLVFGLAACWAGVIATRRIAQALINRLNDADESESPKKEGSWQ